VTTIALKRIHSLLSLFLVIILFLASLPIQAVQASEPPVDPEVTAMRIGDLPIGTKIRDSVDWDYFTGKEPGWNPTVKDVYKTAPITWILVEKDKHARNTSLFVSEEIVAELDVRHEAGRLQWKDDSLRIWLRETLYPEISPLFRRAIAVTTYDKGFSDVLENDTLFVLAAPELATIHEPFVDPDQTVIPYFNHATNRKANGNKSGYYWTRTIYPDYFVYYMVNNSTGEVRTSSVYPPNGVRPAVNLQSDTIVMGPFIDSDDGSSYYMLAYEKYRGTAEINPAELQAGQAADVLFQVRNVDDAIDTAFSQMADVTISGYVSAPDGTAGSFAGEELSGTQKTIQLPFANGVATVPLVLHSTAKQTLQFQIKGLLEPNVEAIVVQPAPDVVHSAIVERQPVGPTEDGGGMLSTQPALKIQDKFGNPISGVVVNAKKKADTGDWILNGNATVASDTAGIAAFSGLAAINADTTQDVAAAVIEFFIEGTTVAESASFSIRKDSGKLITGLRPVPHDPDHPNVDDPGKFRKVDSHLYITHETSADLLFSVKGANQVEISVDGASRGIAQKDADGSLKVVQGSEALSIDSIDPLLDSYALRLKSLSVLKKSKEIGISATSNSGSDLQSIMLLQAPADILLNIPTKLEINQTITLTGNTDVEAKLPIVMTATEGRIGPVTIDDQGYFSAEFSAPSTAGEVTVTAEAPGVEQPLAKSWDIDIYEPLMITSPDTCNGTAGKPFTCLLTASGGIGDRIWAIESGSFPSGVNLDSRTGLISGTPAGEGTYPLTISVMDSTGEKRAKALTVTIEPSTRLPAPTGLKAIAGDGEVVLSWERVDGATHYDVYEGLASGNYNVGMMRFHDYPDSYSVTGLPNDITRFFAVKAGNWDGESDFSAEVSATPHKNEAPVASRVRIDGTPQVNKTLTGRYTYDDREDDPEGESIFQWYVADDDSGANKQALAGEDEQSLVLTQELSGKYVTFEITPVAASGAKVGTAVESQAVGPVRDKPRPPDPPEEPEPPGEDDDEAAVAADREALRIKYASGDSEDHVTRPVALASSGRNGSTITWSSDNPDIIDDSGDVTRPDSEEGDVLVTLTATIAKGAAAATRSFELTVLAQEEAPEGNANLRDLQLSDGTLSPKFDPEITSYKARVSNRTTSVTVTASVDDRDSTVKIQGKTVPSGQESKAIRLDVGSNDIEVEVEASDGTTKMYTIKVTRAAASSSSGSSRSSRESSKDEDTTPKGLEVMIDGKQQKAVATMSVEKKSGQTVHTVTVNGRKLADQLEKSDQQATVLISVTSPTDKVNVCLTGDAVKAMVEKEAVLEVQTPNGHYKLPAEELQIKQTATQFGERVDLSDLTIQIVIAKSDLEQVKRMEDAAKKGKYTVVVPPVDFSLTAAYRGATIPIHTFHSYVERKIPLPDGISANQVSTAVVYHEQGGVYHVPTYVRVLDGKYVAVVQSLSNGAYSLIGNPMSFLDVNGHWSQEAVNDLASRMIVSGADGGYFHPDKPITRAEFAAIIVRGLGLADDENTVVFRDVNASDWYAGTAAKAKGYGIVDGYEDGSFRPFQSITREEAMVMIARAMKLAGMETTNHGTDVNDQLNRFPDGLEVHSWAKDAVAAAVENGLVNGTSKGLMPKNLMTRAETAAIVQRVLVKAKLIEK